MVVGDFTQDVQTIIIGGGPGGYVAAIRAAQLGREVVLIERDLLGGICLNWGCIPSKAMIEVSGLKHHLSKAAEMGLIVSDVMVDLNKMHAWKDGVVSKLRQGIESLLAKNGVDVVNGTASFSDPGHLLVDTREGLQRFKYEDVIIATGSRPVELRDIPFDGETIIDSNGAISLQEVPKHLLVVGAGSVGIELGMVYRKLGAEVTIIELQEKLLPWLDTELVRVLEKSMSKLGMKLMLGTGVSSLEKSSGTAHITYKRNGETGVLDSDKVLVAVGRRPNTDSLGLEAIGLQPGRGGFLEVNEKMQTGTEHVYAIGDVVAGLMLAHRASHMGKIAAEVIAGKPSAFDNLAVPSVVFSDPEIASVGLSELAAGEKGYRVKSGVFPFRALGRALTLGETEGLTKVITDEEHGTVLGVHIIGPHASDLISEGALAVESGAHFDDLSLTIHAHPTLTEGIVEAAEAMENKAIHIFNPGLKK